MNTELTLTAVAAVLASFSSVASLGWWLSGQFRKVEMKTEETINKHEKVDQQRHDENLRNFQRIYMAMSRARLFNGEQEGDFNR